MNLLKQIFSVKNEYKNNRKYKVVTIFGIKIKRFIENTLSQKPIETPKEPVNPVQYLEKYLYILNENVDTETKEADFCKNPPVIWQMWWNGEGGETANRKCLLRQSKENVPRTTNSYNTKQLFGLYRYSPIHT